MPWRLSCFKRLQSFCFLILPCYPNLNSTVYKLTPLLFDLHLFRFSLVLYFLYLRLFRELLNFHPYFFQIIVDVRELFSELRFFYRQLFRLLHILELVLSIRMSDYCYSLDELRLSLNSVSSCLIYSSFNSIIMNQSSMPRKNLINKLFFSLLSFPYFLPFFSIMLFI